MKTVKTPTLLYLTIWTLALLAGLPALAQDVPDPDSLTFRRTLVAWLECEECSSGEFEAVLELGEEVLPSLGAALELGPSRASKELVRRHLITTYHELKAYEATHPEAAVTVSEKDFVQMYLDNYVATYQVRAAKALAELGGLRAQAYLEKGLKSAVRDDVAAAIRQALAND